MLYFLLLIFRTSSCSYANKIPDLYQNLSSFTGQYLNIPSVRGSQFLFISHRQSNHGLWEHWMAPCDFPGGSALKILVGHVAKPTFVIFMFVSFSSSHLIHSPFPEDCLGRACLLPGFSSHLSGVPFFIGSILSFEIWTLTPTFGK